MGIYETILKAYKEGLNIKISFKDGAVEPHTKILNVYDEFDFEPSDEYLNFYQGKIPTDWRDSNTFTSADYEDVDSVEILD